MTFDDFPVVGNRSHQLSGAEIMMPFAHSDFWIADLGLEFFHWPEQKILKHEMKRGRSCQVLESTNPNPSTNGYSRVVSWIDNETLGIVHAEAYDFKNKLLKEFDPKSFKKVNGRWELQEMEIRNIQTGSRTRLEFDVKKE
ncbi:MAG TPA: outer membrane lipoprotein-sorting protein [Verrucomicrobiae bacterium]